MTYIPLGMTSFEYISKNTLYKLYTLNDSPSIRNDKIKDFCEVQENVSPV